ncbi:MAG: hypothetical protein ACK4UO_11735 [Pseudolabrys sp.]
MRRLKPVVMLAALIALAPALAGCESFDLDKLDVFGLNEKKKLPGERRPLFPEGVPGVSQGIPPEYMMGNRQPEDTSLAPAAPAAEQPAQAPRTAAVAPAREPKPQARPKPRQPRPAAASQPTRVTVQPPAQSAPQQQPAPWPAPQPQQQPAQQPQEQSPWPAPNQSATTAPWPSAPPPGTFSRQ